MQQQIIDLRTAITELTASMNAQFGQLNTHSHLSAEGNRYLLDRIEQLEQRLRHTETTFESRLNKSDAMHTDSINALARSMSQGSQRASEDGPETSSISSAPSSGQPHVTAKSRIHPTVSADAKRSSTTHLHDQTLRASRTALRGQDLENFRDLRTSADLRRYTDKANHRR